MYHIYFYIYIHNPSDYLNLSYCFIQFSLILIHYLFYLFAV